MSVAMTHYQKLIGTTLATTDPALIAVVEEFMRMDRSGLDGLSPDQFAAEAWRAYGDLIELHASGELEPVCRAYGRAVPNLTTV